MNWQQIVVGIILIFTLIVTVVRVIRVLSDPLHKCKDCSQSCGGCSLEELKQSIEEKKKLKRI